jgi:phosphatidate cytidylyltransferase
LLKHRLLTAAIIVVTFLTTLYTLPEQYFLAALVPVVLVAGWEWSNLARIKKTHRQVAFLMLILLLICVVGYILNFFGTIDFSAGKALLIFAVFLWLLNSVFLKLYPSRTAFWSHRHIFSLLGALIIVLTWSSVVIILGHAEGRLILVFGILIVVAADAGGYFGGKLFGNHQLSPSLSPGKTREGFACSLICQVPVALTFVYFFPQSRFLETLVLLVIPVALFSVIGDLFESMIKRNSGFKDSSNLLPGHGGVLDRIDGYMAALPLFGLILLFRPI